MKDDPEDFFPYNDTALNSKTLVPHQDGSVVSMSNSWPGGCEFHYRFRQTSFPAYFHLSPLLKHLRKVVGVIEKKVVFVLLWENKDTHQETSPTWMIWPYLLTLSQTTNFRSF